MHRTAIIAGLSFVGPALAAPTSLTHNGRLLDASGTPVNGPTPLVVTLYDGPGPGATARWTRTFPALDVQDGYFTVVLSTDDLGTPLDTTWFASDLWIGVRVDGTELSRQQVVDVPRAALATHVPVVSTGNAGSCVDTGAIAWDTSANGLLVCDGTRWRRVGADDFLIDLGARRWGDGSVARSCRDYDTPPAGVDFAPATEDGLYWIDPDGSGTAYGEMKVYCDQTTDGGGWTRVTTVVLTTECVFGSAASGDPAVGGNCTKYADATINAIAQDKIFVSRIPGYPSTYTRYSGTIQIGGKPGNVVQGATLAAVQAASPTYTPGYGSWAYFHQNDWYQADRCLGVPPNTARMSFEYAQTSNLKYACYGSCSTDCATRVENVVAEIFIR